MRLGFEYQTASSQPKESRGAAAPEFDKSGPLERAQGRPGARRTHGPRATKKHAAEPQVRAGSTGLPCAMVLTVSFVLFPVTMLFCHRRSLDSLRPATLAPASERQNHTTSPSAKSASRLLSHPRPPHPTLNVRDDAYAPLDEGGTAQVAIDRGQKKSGMFFAGRLDDPNQLERAREIRLFARAV
jgi:hypothetical protein